MSILAIDFGLKRIGVAGSDELNIASHPVKVVINKQDKSHIEEIVNIINERNPSLILVGLPYKDDGRLKIQDHIEEFYKDLVKKTDKRGIALCISEKYFLIEDILIFEKFSFEKIRSDT